MTGRTYKAFISYAHADSAWASWIQRSLETYIPPASVRKALPSKGLRPLTPIFRDTEDFAAGHNLSEQIQTALRSSEYLILVCSPAAAKSKWVNEEIRLFRKFHGDTKILCALVDGVPEDAFPPALTENGSREPLAANPQKLGDGKKLARTKLAAGLLAVPLDTLIQREAQRKYRRVMAVTVAALAGMLFMSMMTLTAVKARKEATARKGDAEGLIEFMLTDLKERLEPVGRLDVLDAVGNRAVEYYEKQDISGMDDSSLARRARAFSLLSEIDRREGKTESAIEQAGKAMLATEALLAKTPNDTQRIFEHSQSTFWHGFANYTAGNYDVSKANFLEYNRLANRLITLEPDNIDWVLEVGYSENNLASTYSAEGEFEKADEAFNAALVAKRAYLKAKPDKKFAKISLASTLGSLSIVDMRSGSLDDAKAHAQEQLSFYAQLKQDYPNDYRVLQETTIATSTLTKISLYRGEADAAKALCLENLDRAKKLNARDPENPRYFRIYATELLLLTKIYKASAEPVLAITTHEALRTLINKAPEALKSSEDWNVSVGLEFERQSLEFFMAENTPDASVAAAKFFGDKIAALKSSGVSQARHLALARQEILSQLYLHEAYVKTGDSGSAQDVKALMGAAIQQPQYRATEFDRIRLKIAQISKNDKDANMAQQRLLRNGHSIEGAFRHPGL